MITVEDLSFGYSDDAPILKNLHARFGEGTATALVGRSGSGKSTLLYLLGLMLTPASGDIRIGGTPTSGLPDATRAELRAQQMGFVFQDALLDPARSVLDNVLEGSLYSGAPKDDRVMRTEHALTLLAKFEVDADPSRRPGQLSGGQAQRVALCRAFLMEPAIVLADEPTGNLDDDTAELVWRALLERAEAGATVVVATHDRRHAARLDDVIEVHNGIGT